MSCSCEGKEGECGCTANVPEEVKKLVGLVTQLADDYTKAVAGNKKRMVASRKGLMEIKKLVGEMRKSALEKCKKAREQADAQPKKEEGQ